MRLLYSSGDEGHFKPEFYEASEPPAYAILSHTWGPADEEVTFSDIQNGTYATKPAYRKLVFCEQQARRDGFRYFWIDTCCINKADFTELSEAINSMYRWYRNASKCYVHLSDVSTLKRDSDGAPLSWDLSFRRSKWFTRGWTLQELIAPGFVEFHTAAGMHLGDKQTLEHMIHEITNLPVDVLRGQDPSRFAISERFRWSEKRKTTKPEDRAYCLMGLFDVSMPLIYGEGDSKAFFRLNEEIEKPNRPLQQLISVPDAAFDSEENRRHRECLTGTRVELLEEIIAWANHDSKQYMYWLKGQAGTGKSTIALTVAQALRQSHTRVVSYFFKRGGGDLARSRSVISTIVLHLAQLYSQFRNLVCGVLQQDRDLGGSASLPNQFERLLVQPLSNLHSNSKSSTRCVIVLDAMDECDDLEDVRLLLRLFGDGDRLAQTGLRIFLTSRPETPIRLGFQGISQVVYRELALQHVARHLVDRDIKTYVTHELELVRASRGLPTTWPDETSTDTIVDLAGGLFIYAATVCRYIDGPRLTPPTIRLKQICYGAKNDYRTTRALDDMYLLVLKSILTDEMSPEEEEEASTQIRLVVGTIALLFEPLSVIELQHLISLDTSSDCGIVSLTLAQLHAIMDVPDKADNSVQLQHLSLRDFLIDSRRCNDTRFYVDKIRQHQLISHRCFDLMALHLKQNICGLDRPDTQISDIPQTTIQRHISPALEYACRHWIDHVCEADTRIDENGPIWTFLENFAVFWIEAMSLIQKFSEVPVLLAKLKTHISPVAIRFQALVQDMERTVRYFAHILSRAPLQLYYSVPTFSPPNAPFHKLIAPPADLNLKVQSEMPREWPHDHWTFEGDHGDVTRVAFSADGTKVTSGTVKGMVSVWSIGAGQCVHQLIGHEGAIDYVTFLPGDDRLLSVSQDHSARIWAVDTGICQHCFTTDSDILASNLATAGIHIATFSKEHWRFDVWNVETGQSQQISVDSGLSIDIVTFSPDGGHLILSSHSGIVRVWNIGSGQLSQELKFDCSPNGWPARGLAVAPYCAQIVIGSEIGRIDMWHATGGIMRNLWQKRAGVPSQISVSFAPDGSTFVTSNFHEMRTWLWEAEAGQCLHVFTGCLLQLVDTAFSADSSRLALLNARWTIQIWDVISRSSICLLEGHDGMISSASFSPDGTSLVSSARGATYVWNHLVPTSIVAHTSHIRKGGKPPEIALSSDQTHMALLNGYVYMWSLDTKECVWERSEYGVAAMAFSPVRHQIAMGMDDGTIEMLNVSTGRSESRLLGHTNEISRVAPDRSGTRVASASYSGEADIRIWNTEANVLLYKLSGLSEEISWLGYSPQGDVLVAGSKRDLAVWDAYTGQLRSILTGHTNYVWSVDFAKEGRLAASASHDGSVRVWDIGKGTCLQMLSGHDTCVFDAIFSADGFQVASCWFDSRVLIWCLRSGRLVVHEVQDWYNFSRRNLEFSTDGSALFFGGMVLCTTSEKQYIEGTSQVVPIAVNASWIVLSSIPTVWLPPDYRREQAIYTRSLLVIKGHNDRVTFYEIKE